MVVVAQPIEQGKRGIYGKERYTQQLPNFSAGFFPVCSALLDICHWSLSEAQTIPNEHWAMSGAMTNGKSLTNQDFYLQWLCLSQGRERDERTRQWKWKWKWTPPWLSP